MRRDATRNVQYGVYAATSTGNNRAQESVVNFVNQSESDPSPFPRHVHLPLSTSSMSLDPESTESKLEVAHQKKATGDAAFKAGNLTDGK
jgi:hypothetical protein